jgi:ABC-type bacteriocin/lantibiotic exporter with double-glycine peptidase domain
MHKVKVFKQSRGYCGPASLKILLSHYGIRMSEGHLARLTNASREKGTRVEGLVSALRSLGFKAEYQDNCSMPVLERELSQRPAIVNWFLGDEGHYSVVIGYNRREIIYADPFFGEIKRMPKKRFLAKWFDYNGEVPKDQSDFILRRMITAKLQ